MYCSWGIQVLTYLEIIVGRKDALREVSLERGTLEMKSCLIRGLWLALACCFDQRRLHTGAHAEGAMMKFR